MNQPPYSSTERKVIIDRLRNLPDFGRLGTVSAESAIQLALRDDIEPLAWQYSEAMSERHQSAAELKESLKASEAKLLAITNACDGICLSISNLQRAIKQLTGFERFYLAFNSTSALIPALSGFLEELSKYAEVILKLGKISGEAATDLRPLSKRPKDDIFNTFFDLLVLTAWQYSGHEPTYSKPSGEVSGPWIDYLMACIRPLRPHTTPASLGAMIDRWRRRNKR